MYLLITSGLHTLGIILINNTDLFIKSFCDSLNSKDFHDTVLLNPSRNVLSVFIDRVKHPSMCVSEIVTILSFASVCEVAALFPISIDTICAHPNILF